MTNMTFNTFSVLHREFRTVRAHIMASVAVVLSVVFVSSAYATTEAKMLSTMIQKIEKMHNARAFEVAAEEYEGRQVYEIETLRNGAFYESYIDPQSGQILADEKETTPFWNPFDEKEKQAVLAATISLWQAIEAVSDKNGSPLQEAIFT